MIGLGLNLWWAALAGQVNVGLSATYRQGMAVTGTQGAFTVVVFDNLSYSNTPADITSPDLVANLVEVSKTHNSATWGWDAAVDLGSPQTGVKDYIPVLDSFEVGPVTGLTYTASTLSRTLAAPDRTPSWW